MTIAIPDALLRDAAGDLDGGAVHPAFAAFVAERCATAESLEALYARDLYLAFLALHGRDDAICALGQRVTREAEAVVRHARSGDGDDLAQRALLLLLRGGPDGVAKLAQYAGRAPLGAWLRVVLVRMSQSGARRDEVLDDDALGDLVSPADDPALAYMKHAYRAVFKEAFAAAIAGLSLHDRMLLRQHYLDGLGLDELGRLHRVHRATAARWLASVREQVFGATQRHMQVALPINRAELDEVMALIRSRLDASISRLLASQAQ